MSDGDTDNRLWDNLSQSAGFGEAPQQAFLQPPRDAKIASVATLALLAVSAYLPKIKKSDSRFSNHLPLSTYSSSCSSFFSIARSKYV